MPEPTRSFSLSIGNPVKGKKVSIKRLGTCERKKHADVLQLIYKRVHFIYVLALPIAFVFSIGYFVVPAAPFIFYVMASLELIAESIEDPFGVDPDDLPIDKTGENIRNHVADIIH